MVSTSPSEAGPGDGQGLTPTGMRPACPDRLAARIPEILPHARVFPIQIGSELFKLSGASLCSDAPSYFSQSFLCQIKAAEDKGEDVGSAIRTLYIDRDPATFRDIVLHLQGYHVTPRDGTHFVRLFADAQFYSLPKLMGQLFEESIFISIGHREFQIPRDLLTGPTNSPNYFSLGFAAFFSRPDNLFPGVDREGLLRPPAILPPSVPNRSADCFAELLRMLQGYPVAIRDDAHRRELLRDARYFHFKGLEQQLIPHAISYNPLRQRHEMVLRLENVQKSGVSVVQDHETGEGVAWVNYARPYVDDRAAELILEIGGDATRLHMHMHMGADGPRAEFFRDTKARVAKLLEVVATKLNLPPTTQPLGLLMVSGGGASAQPATPGNTPLSEDLVRVCLGPEAAVVLDGKAYHAPGEDAGGGGSSGSGSGSGDADAGDAASSHGSRKRRRPDGAPPDDTWTVRTAQWRMRIQGCRGGKSAVECVLVAVKVDAVRGELGRNMARPFLGP